LTEFNSGLYHKGALAETCGKVACCGGCGASASVCNRSTGGPATLSVRVRPEPTQLRQTFLAEDFMSKFQKLLFICYQNRSRSLTAERLFQGSRDYAVKSAGTAQGPRTRVTTWHIRWADQIFVMEEMQALLLKEQFGELLSDKPVICLDIPDVYRCMEPALIEELRATLSKYLNAPERKAA
jgi:predicted protein tyrosine phosphatase